MKVGYQWVQSNELCLIEEIVTGVATGISDVVPTITAAKPIPIMCSFPFVYYAYYSPSNLGKSAVRKQSRKSISSSRSETKWRRAFHLSFTA